MKTKTKTETDTLIVQQDLIDYGVAKIKDKDRATSIVEELIEQKADEDFIKTTFDMLVDEANQNLQPVVSGDVHYTFDDDQTFQFDWSSYVQVTPAEIRKIMADNFGIGTGYRYSYNNGGFFTTNVVINTNGIVYYWDDDSVAPHYVTTLAEHRGVRKEERKKYAIGTIIKVDGLTRVIYKIGRHYHRTKVILNGKIAANHEENGMGYSVDYLDKNAKILPNLTVKLPKIKKLTIKDVVGRFPVGSTFRDNSDGRTINVQKHGRTRIYYNNTWNCSIDYAIKNWVKPEDYKP